MQDNQRQRWWKTCLAGLLALGISTGAPAATYITTSDNENNAHTGQPDDDMTPNTDPPCVMNNQSNHPVEFNIDVSGPAPTRNAYLAVFIKDVDWPYEKDEVFLNGHSLGFAVGEDQLDGSTLFVIPDVSWVKSGKNLVEIHVDTLNVAEYCAPVPWGQLIIDEGLGAGTATIRTLASSANAYDFSDAAQVDLEVDTSLGSQPVRLELTLRDPTGAIVDFDSNQARENWVVSGTADEPYSWAFSLPVTGPQGIWQAMVAVYDVATNRFQATRTVSFSVPKAASLTPSLLSITPNKSVTGSATAVTITGSNFVQGATSCAIGGKPLTNLVAVTGNTVTANVDPSLAVGVYDVTCTTENGTGTLAKGMTITGPLPTVTAISPTSAPAGAATAVTITGSNFVQGATSCSIGSYALTNLTAVNATTVTGNVALAAPAGVHDVSCTTAAGTGTLPKAMTLTSAQPGPVTVTGITPASAPVGVATAVTVTGTNFVAGATSCSIGAYTLTNQVAVNTTTVTGKIPTGAPAGTYNVTCTTAAGSASLPNGMTLTAASAVSVTAINPAVAPVGAGTAVTITGANFAAGATSCAIGNHPLVNQTAMSATAVTGTIPTDAPAGTYTVSCTTAAGSGALPNGMKLTASAPVPTLAPLALALLSGMVGIAGALRRRAG